MVTGGQRSGKSEFAESLALKLSGTERPVYVATAQVAEGDEEFARRVERHRQRRGERWISIEEPLRLSRIEFDAGSIVLIDCLTLWATNAFFETAMDIDLALRLVDDEFTKLAERDATIIIVTNEVGLGGISADAMQRQFADLQGAANSNIARRANDVYMIISGIPVKIK